MLYNGFNETEDLRIVFEGLNPHIASARLFLNYRFAQANRIYSIGYGSLGYPDAAFPFAYEKLRDPKSLREDGLLERCRKTGNCPKILQTVCSTEYWQGAHSLNTTDPMGEQDIALPGERAHLPLRRHRARHHGDHAERRVRRRPPNTWVDPRPAMRALILALDRWVKTGAPPPASVYPRIADGTLVPASSLKWPAIPASGTFTFTAPRSPNPMPQFDYGARFADGIIDTVPPAVNAFRYKVLVPAIDADGNEIAGLRLPEQAVPAATTTGWSVRSAEGGSAGELCYLDGIALPFARTAAEREAAQGSAAVAGGAVPG